MMSVIFLILIILFIMFKILSQKEFDLGFKKEAILIFVGLFLLWPTRELIMNNHKLLMLICLTSILGLSMGYLRGITYKIYRNNNMWLKKGSMLTILLFILTILFAYFLNKFMNANTTSIKSNMQILSLGISTLGSKLALMYRINK